jgi:CO dehydrogenase/acetyl-CoA synthase beta subunit
VKLFDEMIIEITGELCHLAPMEAARLEKPRRPWADVGAHHMILAREMAYELGGAGTLGLSGCLYTTEPILFPQGVYLYGKDLPQIRESQSYARLVLVELEETDSEEALYRKFREVDYVRYHIHPEGYMARISPVSQREPVRVSQKALKKGVRFAEIGDLYLMQYQKIPQIKTINVIFVTHPAFDYCMLEDRLGRAEQITQSLNHIFTGLSMDCDHCGLKTVCDEVEGLRELHFRRA